MIWRGKQSEGINYMVMEDLKIWSLIWVHTLKALKSSFDVKSNYNLKEDKNCGKKL